MVIPKAFIGYVNNEKTEILTKSILRESFTLTIDDALEDLECFKYIMDNAYSGKEYWENNGIIFTQRYEAIKNFIINKDEIYTNDLCKKYYESFNDICDGHLSFTTYKNRFTFNKLFQAYFSDLIIEQDNGALFVAYSNIDTIRCGMKVVCGVGSLFSTLSPTNRHFFLYGVRSWNSIECIDIIIDGINMSVPVHKCRAGNNRIYSLQNLQDYNAQIGILECPSFAFADSYDSAMKDELYSIGQALKQKQTAVWNILSNGGGSSNYPMKFIEGLNQYANWKADMGILHSPITDSPLTEDNGTAVREWEFIGGEEYDLSGAEYNGDLIVLMNSHVASSGEAAVAYSSSVKNRILIGESTMGCGTFGDVLSFRLPFSLMRLTIPYKLFLGMGKEGEGIEPDFWVDSDDVLGEVLEWLTEKEEYFPRYI